ncbi:phage holin family protein [Cephaloticoccus capnophilus]|uniref:phage holin family protein n=1 Tax=Cephaloticoccus capnophilus TaxID=1548208 RepID=UPI000838C7A3|nr:phage holin family protein [Cephaloticoccus capnophilus]
MNTGFPQLIIRWLVLAVGVTVATHLIPGIACETRTALFVVVLLLSFLNAILRPILVFFTLPFIVATLGFGMVVINALLFLLVGRLVEGFYVSGFWAAVGGSLIVSATNYLLGSLLRGSAARQPRSRLGPPNPPSGGSGGSGAADGRRPSRKLDSDVIDI